MNKNKVPFKKVWHIIGCVLLAMILVTIPYLVHIMKSMTATIVQHREISTVLDTSNFVESGNTIQHLQSWEVVQIYLWDQSLQLNLSGNAKISVVQWSQRLYRIPWYYNEPNNHWMVRTRREIWRPFIDLARDIYALFDYPLYSYAPSALVEWSPTELKEKIIEWGKLKDFIRFYDNISTYLQHGDGCDWCEGPWIYLSKLFYRLHHTINHYTYHEDQERQNLPYDTTYFSGYVVPLWWFGYSSFIGQRDVVVVIQAVSWWVEWLYDYRDRDPISSWDKRELLEFLYE